MIDFAIWKNKSAFDIKLHSKKWEQDCQDRQDGFAGIVPVTQGVQARPLCGACGSNRTRS